MTKEVDEFSSILNQGISYIEKGDFDKAILLYSKIRSSFERLPKMRKTEELVKKVNLFYEELSLYLELNEANILANEGKLEKLKQILDHIYDLEIELNEVKSASSLLKTAELMRKDYINFYKVKGASKKFNETYDLVEELIKKRKWNSVFREYAHLLFLYNQIIVIDESKKENLYDKLNNLLRNIKVYKSMHDSYNKPTKNHKEEIKKESVKVAVKEAKKLELKEKTKDPSVNRKKIDQKKVFKDLRKAIEEGDIEEAVELLNS